MKGKRIGRKIVYAIYKVSSGKLKMGEKCLLTVPLCSKQHDPHKLKP